MRIRKKFAFIFLASLVSFFVVFYIWINTALPVNNSPVASHLFESERRPDPLSQGKQQQDKLLRHREDEEEYADVGGQAARRPGNRHESVQIDTQDLIKDAMIKAKDPKTQHDDEKCPIGRDTVPAPDIQMLDVYRELAFDNPDGGVWKQGWNIEYDPKHWNSHHKLKVFIVPHSHNDPGWLKTFDKYYETETRLILANMLRHLDENPDMRFIWAEISYFSRWYEQLGEEAQRKVQAFVDRKQLEFVTGGWVMNDEANSHWLSILQQLSEGQTWLVRHLNVTPTSHWSIDPFGYSPTQAYLVKGTGIQHMLIQRAHYAIKKRFASERTLEFRWRQLWDERGASDILTHLMPFYSYDVPHTCGPDPNVCCQFDFKRLPGYGVSCPWRVAPQPITDRNVASRAALIVDQWRKKSMLFRTRSVLVPLGDDFRYSQSTEWVAQMQNYGKLFEYINSEAQLNVEVRFATLQDYFEGVAAERPSEEWPTFSGDFFTYADKDDNYWSGYYTSRPYHKRLDRVLMGYLRSAEMLHAWRAWDGEGEARELQRWLENGRRALAIFQHHDGVTGTAKDHVVQDYERMMTSALRDVKRVIQQAAYRLLTQPTVYQPDYHYEYFNVDEFRSPNPDEGRPTIIIGDELPTKHVVLHNSLPYEREELVNFHVARPFAMVMDSSGMPVACQFEPVYRWHKDGQQAGSAYRPQPSTTKYRLSFRALLPPLGLRVYSIHATATAEQSHLASYARVAVYSDHPFPMPLGEYPHEAEFLPPQEVALHWEGTGAGVAFHKDGLLKSMTLGAGLASVPVRVEFLQYGVKRQQESSGAYLFMPDGPARGLPREAGAVVVVVTRGELGSTVATGLDFGVHSVVLRDGDGVEIENVVDVTHLLDTEVVMRVSSGLASGDHFFTDLNGLQWIKRQRFEKLPLQANYYPVPSGIFVEDERHRLSLLSGQSLGGSSLAAGQLEVMQDRRLQRDDNRGLGQGVLDNRKTLHVFRLLLEAREGCTGLNAAHPSGFLTTKAHELLQAVTHPMERLVFAGSEWSGMVPQFGENRDGVFGVDVAVMRSLPAIRGRGSKSAVGLVLHRPEFDRCSAGTTTDAASEVNVWKLLDREEGDGEGAKELYEAPLNLVRKGRRLESEVVTLCAMDIKGVIVPR